MANPLKKLAGQTAIYGLSSILGRVANYLLLTPLYTSDKVFSVEQFGVVTDTYAWVAMFIIFFTYGLETGFFRYATKHKEIASQVFSTSIISLLTTTFLLGGIIVLNSQSIAELLKYPDHNDYIILLALIVSMDAITAIPFAQLRLKEKAKKFAFIKLFGLGINIGLNLFYYLFCPWYTQNYNYDSLNWLIDLVYDPYAGVRYVFISNLVASGVTLLLLLPEFFKSKWSFNFVLWKEIMIYSAPLLIVGLSGSINQHFDKLVFKFVLPESLYLREVGIYGAIYKLSIMITLFIQAFQYAADPFFFKYSENNDSKLIFAKVLKYFTIITCCGFLVIMLYIDVVKKFISSEEYYEGLFVLPWLMMGAIFFGIYYNLSNWYKLSGKTYYGALLSGIGSIITLTGNILLIPVFESIYPGEGYIGAAITTFLCFFIMTVFSYFLGQKHYPVKYPVKRIAFYLVFSFVIFLVADNFTTDLDGALSYVANTFLIAVYLTVVYILERPKKVINLNT